MKRSFAHPALAIVTSRIIYLMAVIPALSVHGQITLQVAPSDYNGYHVSCFGGADGAIDLTVSGGTPPYSFDWSTGATTEDVSDLRAGFIAVIVRDSQTGEAREELTLTEPNKLEADVVPYLYASGYNISCFNCYNGSIQVTATEGVPPYSYAWTDGPTNEDRVQLDAGSYQVDVTDANGCLVKGSTLLLTQPERDDWTRTGNAGTDLSTQFLGTTDNKDVVFKSNGAERLRLLSSGDITLFGGSSESGPLHRDADGFLRIGGYDELTEYPCAPDLRGHPYWRTTGNTFPNLCEGAAPPVLGTKNGYPLRVITNNVERKIVSTTGKVGIGTTPPGGNVDQYRLYVEDGIVTRDVLVKVGTWPDYVFNESYHLMPLEELRAYLRSYKHLPGIPSSAEVEVKQGVEVGDLQARMLKVVEEQALYILDLEERMERMERRMMTLESTQH